MVTTTWIGEHLPVDIRCGAVEEFVTARNKEVKRVRHLNKKRGKESTTPAFSFELSFKTSQENIPLLKRSWGQKRSDSSYRGVLHSDLLTATESNAYEHFQAD